MLIGNIFGTENIYLCLLDFCTVKYKLHLYLDLLIFQPPYNQGRVQECAHKARTHARVFLTTFNFFADEIHAAQVETELKF